jgi:hypothetical protein
MTRRHLVVAIAAAALAACTLAAGACIAALILADLHCGAQFFYYGCEIPPP